MKKVFIVLLFIILFIGCNEIEYKLLDNNNKPTIDFLQPWAFYNKSEEELLMHMQKLKEYGYEELIIQNIAKYEKGEPIINYYKSNIEFTNSHEYFLDRIINQAKKEGIKIICGISSDTYWWDDNVHKFDDETMNIFYNEEITTINELITNHDIDGIYYSNEIYSNNKGYIKNWCAHLNNIINYVENLNKDLPIYISPFNSSYYSTSKNARIKFWNEFFQNTNFRKNDLFLLQDGCGGISPELNIKEMSKIFDLNKAIRNTCLSKSKMRFALNIELFSNNGLAKNERVEKQNEYANKLGDVIATFSVSHYIIENGGKV